MIKLSNEEHKLLDNLYQRKSGTHMGWYNMSVTPGTAPILIWYCRLCDKEIIRQKWLAGSGSKLAEHGLSHLREKGLLIFI